MIPLTGFSEDETSVGKNIPVNDPELQKRRRSRYLSVL
jgi:hypothetical protein